MHALYACSMTTNVVRLIEDAEFCLMTFSRIISCADSSCRHACKHQSINQSVTENGPQTADNGKLISTTTIIIESTPVLVSAPLYVVGADIAITLSRCVCVCVSVCVLVYRTIGIYVGVCISRIKRKKNP